MLIATSLMYSEDEYEIQKQKKAMQTWQDAGFDVISCNVKEEIEILQEAFPEVHFVELKRSGKEITSKPFPYIYDILQILKNQSHSQDEVCGIVNSDIFIKDLQGNKIGEYLSVHRDTMFILHRYDIEDEFDVKGEYYFSGIDAFFFLTHFLHAIPDKGYMLGRPEWDHWFVLEASRAGITVREIKNKMAFHIKHKQRWTASESNKMATRQAKKSNSVDMDEAYFYQTNECMSDLSTRIYYENCFEESSKTVIKKDGYYCDIDRDKLLKWEKDNLQESEPVESVGILYFKEGKAYRLCAAHCEIIKNLDGTFSFGQIFANERDKGNILRYIDFKDLDFVRNLGRTYVYPAGRAARLLVDCLDANEIPVLGMVDRDEALWGKTYRGKEIFDLSVLDDKDSYDSVLIATNLYVREIYEALSRVVPKEKLIVL